MKFEPSDVLRMANRIFQLALQHRFETMMAVTTSKTRCSCGHSDRGNSCRSSRPTVSHVSRALLRAAGASEERRRAVGCVQANLAGHDSHGVIAIPTYIDRIKAGISFRREMDHRAGIADHHGDRRPLGVRLHVNAKAMA